MTHIPQRRSRAVPPTTSPDIAEDERYYQPAQMGTSARRYVNTEGREVIERGHQRVVVRRQPAGSPQPPRPQPQRSAPCFRLIMIGMGMMVVVILLLNWLGSLWQAHQIDATYGSPRTYQVDAVVGHHDSASHPSHFLFLNLHDRVVIVEFPGGDVSHARVYVGPTLVGPDADAIPITGTFEDRNGDGKPDLIVHIQQEEMVYLNDGTAFKTA